MVLTKPGEKKKSTVVKDLIALFKGSVFIFFLAFGRFLLHREIDYHVRDLYIIVQSHVTEWGVHWNFYATIYVVSLVLVLIQNYLTLSLPIALIIMIGYEFSLHTLGLK